MGRRRRRRRRLIVDGIPRELDALVMSLLSLDARARPASAGEVIARLNAIGELPPEPEGDADLLAQSFLLSPRFTGRAVGARRAPAARRVGREGQRRHAADRVDGRHGAHAPARGNRRAALSSPERR